MATITEIHEEILNAIATDEVLSTKLTSTSKVSVFRLYSYVIATLFYLQQQLYGQHKVDVDATLASRLAHNKSWYSNMAKAFQFGDDLQQDSDTYALIDEDKQIVSNASVDESLGDVIIKVAKTADNALVPLAAEEIAAFTSYINEIKDAGVFISIVNEEGDLIQISADIWYDPLVLDGNGQLLADGSTKPAEETIKTFIKTLKFNGEFVVSELADALQATEGVAFPVIKSIKTQYQSNDWTSVDGKEKSFAGYYNIDNLDLTYVPNV